MKQSIPVTPAMLMFQKVPALLLATLMTLAYQPSSAAETEESAALQRQAAQHLYQGIRQHDEQAIDKAMTLAERILTLSPDNLGAWHTKLQAQLYRHQYQQALSSVNEAQQRHPNDQSLRLLHCMLVDRSQGEAAGDACYAKLEQEYASQAANGQGETRPVSNAPDTASPVAFNQVGAAILGGSPHAQALAEAYVAQVRSLGGIEAEDIARHTVESLQDGRYVEGVLMTGRR
ncbi:tetratricopeptide repeat protein [Modicisalibacter luteus]|uniref:Tetratricopeptide repeat protein n=1 Tax=Modicisalibacter luteus TaxID=453962 RepID=A0ABV7M818_9GAMM|nr:hypothetical protein [Halomonas lutea]